MKFDHSHLAALVAIIRSGNFEKAARDLHVTPSAISQRIRAIEEQMGTVLLIRETPCRLTKDGEKLYRHALQIDLLEHDLLYSLHQSQDQGCQIIPVAVSADCLATWFVDAIRLFNQETGACVEALSDNQDHTTTWLREGRVLGAVTSSSKPVQGCRIDRLKPMRYIPMATPAFMRQYFPHGRTYQSFKQAPMLMFDGKDRLQHDFVKKMN